MLRLGWEGKLVGHNYCVYTVLCASWGVAPSIELWLLNTRAGVQITLVLTNAMHKIVELYALNQITLGVIRYIFLLFLTI